MAVDPFSYAVGILLRGDGADGLTDAGPHRMPVEAATRATKSTSIKKYGAASIYFDGGGVIGSTVDYARFGYATSIGPSPALGLGAGDFTLRFWIYPQTHSNSDPRMVSNDPYSNNWSTWYFSVNKAPATGKFSFWACAYSTSVPLLTSSSSVAYDTWSHIEITRSGSSFRLMVNGVVEATGTYASDIDGGYNYFYIGSRCPGYIDDFQFYKGVALHSGDFTPPDAELEIDPVSLAAIDTNIQVAGLPSGQYSTKLLGDNIRVRDEYFGGDGRVRGTVKLKNTPTNTPLARRVYLMRDEDMKVIRTSYSSAAAGEYEFQWIDKTKKYTVLSVDYEHTLRAVVADNLTAEAMP